MPVKTTRWLVWPGRCNGSRGRMGRRARRRRSGKSVTEAMACGCACVVNDIAVLREMADGAARAGNFGYAKLARERVGAVLAVLEARR